MQGCRELKTEHRGHKGKRSEQACGEESARGRRFVSGVSKSQHEGRDAGETDTRDAVENRRHQKAVVFPWNGNHPDEKGRGHQADAEYHGQLAPARPRKQNQHRHGEELRARVGEGRWAEERRQCGCDRDQPREDKDQTKCDEGKRGEEDDLQVAYHPSPLSYSSKCRRCRWYFHHGIAPPTPGAANSCTLFAGRVAKNSVLQPGCFGVVTYQFGRGGRPRLSVARTAPTDTRAFRSEKTYFFCSSLRSVAGGGVRESAVISARSAGLISIFTESSEACSWSMLRAPMIGAVMAGCVATQATAAPTGCSPRPLQKATNLAAISCIQGSP